MQPVQGRDIYPELTWSVLGCALEVHKTLGPGLLEGTYRRCLVHELQLKNMRVDAEVPIPIQYKGLAIEHAYRADLIVENTCLVELKAVEKLGQIHDLQALTYLRLARLPVGLLINFNSPRLKEGVRRFINV